MPVWHLKGADGTCHGNLTRTSVHEVLVGRVSAAGTMYDKGGRGALVMPSLCSVIDLLMQ